MQSFNDRDFRDALSAFATGVTIITTKDDTGAPVGMTASSFNSVSMDPPLVLWSVTKTAHAAPVFEQAEHFAVHVLGADQIDTSNRFARRGEDKFGPTDYITDANGIPCIADCAVRFDCKTWAVNEGGDHWIIIGEVLGMERQQKEGLVFAGGSYATASPIRQPGSDGANGPDQEAEVEGMLLYQLARAYRQLSSKFHDEVREAGLSVSEWRVLASLHPSQPRDLDELSRRSFVRQDALMDMVLVMEENGLCTVAGSDKEMRVQGTAESVSRIEHLMALGREMEMSALAGCDEATKDTLFGTLRDIINNTNA